MTAASGLIAELRAEVRVDLDKFRGEIEGIKRQARTGSRDLEKSFGGVRKSIEGLSGPLRAFRGALAAAGIGLGVSSAIGLGRRALETADSIDKVSQRLGVNVEALQELRFAFQLNGVEQSNFDLALQRFTRRTAEAARGTGEAKDALRELGIQITDASGNLRPAEELLADVADAMQRLQSPSERVRLAFKLFDSEGVALVNTLSQGSSALEQLRQQARDTGQVIREGTVKELVRFKDELDIISGRLSNQFVRALGGASIAVRDFFDATGVRSGAPLEDVRERLEELRRIEQEALGDLTVRGLQGEDGIGIRVVQSRLERTRELIRELESRLDAVQSRADSAAGPVSGIGEGTGGSDKELQDQRRVLESLREARIRATEDAIGIAEFERDERLRLIQEFVKDASAAERARADSLAIFAAEIKEIQDEQLDEQIERDRQRIGEELRASRERTREIERAVEESNDRMADADLERHRKLREFSRTTAERIVEDGRVSFRGLAEAFQQEFLTRAVSSLIESGLKDIGGLLRGASGGGGVGGSLASLALGAAGVAGGFAGFFADGGRIPAGRFGVVGERGPEIVSGPGTVTPMGGGGVVVNLITDQPAQNVQVREAGVSGGQQVVNVVVGRVMESIARGDADRVLRSRFNLTPRTA